MIQLSSGIDFSVTSRERKSLIQSLLSKRKELGFIDVDTIADVKAIKEFVSRVWDDFEYVVVLGIGGSALGTKALIEGLYGKYYNEDRNKNGKNIYVLDNIDADALTDTLGVIDIEKALFCFISKSGGTIETLSEYLFFREKIQEKTSSWKKHFCFIVGENCSMKEELEKSFPVFYIPENIGGRFSVFTPVGLIPLAFTGIDIELFLEGISESKSRFLSEDTEQNTSLELALLQYHAYKNEKNITVFFPYSSRMFQIGEWYKQLMGESIGKDRQGITLTSSLGVTDQHSQLQLYQDGPQDKLFLFLDVQKSPNDYKISTDEKLTFQKLLEIEKYGTMTSLKNEGHPVCNISVEILDAKHIAELLYMFMFQIAYLGELFDINAFDQPGVEKSKIITKQKLAEEYGDMDLFHKAFYE